MSSSGGEEDRKGMVSRKNLEDAGLLKQSLSDGEEEGEEVDGEEEDEDLPDDYTIPLAVTIDKPSTSSMPSTLPSGSTAGSVNSASQRYSYPAVQQKQPYQPSQPNAKPLSSALASAIKRSLPNNNISFVTTPSTITD